MTVGAGWSNSSGNPWHDRPVVCALAHMQSSIGVGEGSEEGGGSALKDRRRLTRGGQAKSIWSIWATQSRHQSQTHTYMYTQ